MEQLSQNIDVRRWVRAQKTNGQSVAFVPTMGALHAGHMELVRAARLAADCVIVSIFVNPTQFDGPDDLMAYPQQREHDLALLKAAGVDALFSPEVLDIYPNGAETVVHPTRLANILMGLERPGHFQGVATVVTKLFNIVTPDFAVFGQKDYQQLQLIKTLVRDLCFPIEIIGHPTVRDATGLALSSRNLRLSTDDRTAATVLNKSLDLAQAAVLAQISVERLHDMIHTRINAEPRAVIRSIDIVSPDHLSPVTGQITDEIAILLAVEFGDVLLLDQRVMHPHANTSRAALSGLGSRQSCPS